MRIICGTDFSKPAMEAANVAAAIAKRGKDTLHLVHVMDDIGIGATAPELLAELANGTTERLDVEAERLRKLGAMVKEQMMHGLPDEKLVEMSRRPGVRLMVVSSLGRRSPGHWLVGSVSERTAESAAVPTLVIRDAAPFEAWAEGKKPLKVFVAVDFTVSAKAALQWVKELKKIGPCKVIIGHVDWPPAERTRLGLAGPLSLTENPPEAQHVLERDLGARAREILGDNFEAVRVMASWGRADAALIEMASREKADLIVTGTHQHHGLQRFSGPSVSRGLLHYAPMSVVCVPTPAATAHRAGTLPQIQRVLATTDFSDLGDRAIPHAYAVVQCGGVIKLIHVISPWKLPDPLVPHYQRKRLTQRQHNQLVIDSIKKLRALIPRQAEALGIRTEVEVVQDIAAAKAICQTAERFGADIICMGTHGRSGLSATILGSVTKEVMAKSKRPLLVLRTTENG